MAVKIWEMHTAPESPVIAYISQLMVDVVPWFEFPNRTEMLRYLNRAALEYADKGGRLHPRYYQEMPPPKLVISEAMFSGNYFHLSVYFVSARLRAALQLPADCVMYTDVDLSGCPASVQAVDYKVMHILKNADPFDKERSTGQWVECPGPAGKPLREWQFGPSDPDTLIPKKFIRDDFAPPAPLFKYQPTGFTMVTDELAERVLRADIADVGFLDPTNDGTQETQRWKTLDSPQE